MIIPEAQRLQNVSEYYFSRKLREISILRLEGHDIINLGIGSPDGMPPPGSVEELKNEASKSGNHGYQSYVGIPELRPAIADYVGSIYKVELQPDNEILPLIGSKEGIMHVSMAFLNPDDVVLVPNPGYPTYSSVSRLLEAKCLTYNLNSESNWMIDFDYLESLPLDNVKLMWVNFPNMPTGTRGDKSQFTRLIQLAKKHSFLIVNDNPYSLLFKDNPLSVFQADGAKEVCLELNSLSKSHNMAGWRLGWVAGNEDYIKAILKVKSNMDSGMFLPVQKAAITALKQPEKWYEGLHKTYSERRISAFKILKSLGCEYASDQGGMFVWGKLPDDVTNVNSFIDDLIINAGVFIVPGHVFGSNGARCIRISLCSSNQVLDTAFERVSNYLNNKVK